MGLFIVELFLFIGSVFLVGLLTAAEIALSSFGENKIDKLKEKGDGIWQKFHIVHKILNLIIVQFIYYHLHF